MYLFLMLVTVLAVVLLVAVLVKYLMGIIEVLNDIGGTGRSLLAKLRVGLRAIEQETGHLPGQATKLNETLSNTSDGLKVVNNHLEGTIEAVSNQKGGT